MQKTKKKQKKKEFIVPVLIDGHNLNHKFKKKTTPIDYVLCTH